MSPHNVEIRDVRDALGMRLPSAWVVAGTFMLTNIVMALTNLQGIEYWWSTLPAIAVATLAVIGVMSLPGEPIQVRYAILLAAAAPVTVVLAHVYLPEPLFNLDQRWFLPASTAWLAYLCVRGALMWAWVGWIARAAAAAICTTIEGQGWVAGFVPSVIELAPMLMATFFANVVRPTTQSILRFRQQSHVSAAAAAAAAATDAERDSRLSRLDPLVRPLLERIANGENLSERERQQCLILDAGMRDSLRARMLADEPVISSAQRARERGVTVFLLDDGGLNGSSDSLIDQVRTVVADALERASDGSLTARVLPPGRDELATVVVRSSHNSARVVVGRDGTVVTDRSDC